VSDQLALLPEYLTAHVQLTLLALLCSAAISLPLGVLVTRVAWLEQPALALAGVIQTVPSLALLAVMVPLLAALDLQSIGFLPAIIGLTLYGVLPILRNTVTGIATVDPALKEAARGVGMTPLQELVRVDLPLAMPVIVAGIRTATAWIVGVATLSTPVGATSLGNYIFSGLQTRNSAAVLVGCTAAAALALVLDGLVRALETGIRTGRPRLVVASLTLLTGLYAYTGITLTTPLLRGGDRPIVIGSKTFTEQYILSSALAGWIERQTGRQTILRQSLGSIVAFDALAAGDVDLYVDYSGTLWANEMGRGTTGVNRLDVLREVEAFLRERHGMRLVATLGFENAYALAMRAEDARRLGIRRISDLVPHAPRLVFGTDYEFLARPEWAALRETYGLAFRELRSMDSALMYQAVAQGSVDIISAFSTDGRLDALDLRVFDDDREAIPPYDAVVLASRRLATDEPHVLAALAAFNGAIDAAEMRRMNLAVDAQGRPPAAVAEELLERVRLTTSLGTARPVR
jgi:osmoprotectant transport system permease protein